MSRITHAQFFVCLCYVALLKTFLSLAYHFFFMHLARIISNVIMLLLFGYSVFPPHNCCSLIILVLKEGVRVSGDFAELGSTSGSSALSQ